METNASCVEDVSPPPSTANGNNNNNNKPGRKFGLIGQRPAAGTGTPPNSPAVTADGRRMSVREDQRQQNWMYSLSEQEMEDKFNAICLSIRTESLTLGQRLEHQLAERDLVEANLNQEMKGLHALFVVLKQEVARSQLNKPCTGDGLNSGTVHDIFVRLAHQVEAVHSCALRISSSAESLGAVEYESRLSAAVQILLLYVDNVKRKWEKEHHELEETKRILKESGVNVAQCLANLPEQNPPSGKSSSDGPVSKRRASFPAAPFRRVSLKNPPSSSNRTGLGRSEAAGSVSTDHHVVSSPIQEEREESESAAGQQETASLAAQQASSTVQIPPALPISPPPSTDKGAVTIRRRGKRRSWGSRSASLTAMDSSAHLEGRSSRSRKHSWIDHAGQWTRETLDQLSNTASLCRERWSSLRRKKLQLLRYSASACFLLAALVSLILTFVPSSSSGRVTNSTTSRP